MSVFEIDKYDHTKENLFFGHPVSLARYETQKYSWLDKLTEKQYGFFWLPQKIDITKDKRDFASLTPHEQHIFTSNIKRQILLDSVQGRAPFEAFRPISSLPELEAWLIAWTNSEAIHSRSYTHIIRNIYPNPSKVFDEILDLQEIVDCAKDISVHYDDLDSLNHHRRMGTATDGKWITDQKAFDYEHKKAVWLALMSVNILEGVRFYVSFACSWAFAEIKKMEGNAKIIKLICRDENLHLASTQQLLKALPEEDKDFKKIQKETSEECRKLFLGAIEQEKAWATYLFHGGSMIGLNESLLCDYVDWIARKRMTALDIDCHIKSFPNPLPWTQKWIAGQEVQVAPQEVEIASYVEGGIRNDVDESTFKSFKL